MSAWPIALDDVKAARERLRPHLPPTPLRSYAALDIKATGVGNLIFTARESGLYTLRFTSRQPWKGVIRMSWRPAAELSQRRIAQAIDDYLI